MDEQPVDLAYALLVPEEATDEHLQLLAELAREFHDPELCKQLRDATEPGMIPQLMKGDPEGEPSDDAPSGPSSGSVRLPA